MLDCHKDQINSLQEEIEKNLETIYQSVEKIINCTNGQDACVINKQSGQEELSKLMVLLQRIERQFQTAHNDLGKLKELNTLIKSLDRAIKFSQPTIASSQNINQSVLDSLRRIRSVTNNSIVESEQSKQNNNDHDSILKNMFFVSASGTLGGVVSILSRLKQFDKSQNYHNSENSIHLDPAVPIFLGAFKPIIASSFGLLIFALIESGIVQIDSINNRKNQEKAFFGNRSGGHMTMRVSANKIPWFNKF